ncbi:MAG TPA: fasciclin [Xanthomonadaceae bacterium]|nr:fasciclin [Xanthomonadaceae bacterium]
MSFAHRSLLTLAVATAVAAPAVAHYSGGKPKAAPAAQAQSAGTIVDVAAGNPDFSTLVAALKAAGLVETLSGSGPFTVFAPTNAAFAKLPAGTLENLLKPENKAQLTAILTYHVVSGKVKAADAVKLDEATTVNGAKADINVSGSTVTIDGATITATDVAASNGVIHVIDSVMLPE